MRLGYVAGQVVDAGEDAPSASAERLDVRLDRLLHHVVGEAGPDTWGGLSLAYKSEADEPMLHDELYESYFLYKKD